MGVANDPSLYYDLRDFGIMQRSPVTSKLLAKTSRKYRVIDPTTASLVVIKANPVNLRHKGESCFKHQNLTPVKPKLDSKSIAPSEHPSEQKVWLPKVTLQNSFDIRNKEFA
jgi:hypothetical protein